MPSWFERSKFKWNIYTILFMGIELASYQIEYTYGYRIKYWEIGIYILLLLYLKVQFKEPWKDSLINYILCIVLTAVLQVICYLPFVFLYPKQANFANQSVNILLLCVAFALYKLKIWNRISTYMRQRGKIVNAFLAVTVLIIIVSMYHFEVYKELQELDYFILVISIVLLFALLLLLQKERVLNNQLEADMIKIMGILIDNAVEEVKQDKYIDKKIEIEIAEDNDLRITVGNVCRFIRMEEAVSFFKKGISSKGNNRGLGLYSVKNLVKKWEGEVYTDNEEKSGQNWFYITVKVPLHEIKK